MMNFKNTSMESSLTKNKSIIISFFFFLMCSSSLVLGNSQRQNPFVIDTTKIYNMASNWQDDSQIAFDGMNFFIVWEDIRKDDYSQIRGCRITPEGQVLDKGGITISIQDSYAFNPALSFDGTNYLVVWHSRTEGVHTLLKGARVSPAGVVLDTNAIIISYYWSNLFDRPSVSSCSTNFLAVWTHESGGWPDIYGARISTNGVLLDSTPILISNSKYSVLPIVSCGDSSYLVVWEDFQEISWDSTSNLRGARVTFDGVLLDTIPQMLVSYTWSTSSPCLSRFRLNPTLSFGIDNYFLAWSFFDTTDYSLNIYGTRVSPDGIILDTNYISISTTSGNQSHPSIVFNGTEYFISWMDFRNDINGFNSQIFFTTIDTSGNVLDSVGKSLLADTINILKNPSVSTNGNYNVVSFTDRRGNEFKYNIDSDIYLSRVDGVGNQLDPEGINISPATQNQKNPDIGFDGGNLLIVWEDERGQDIDIYGALLDTSGNVITPPGVFVVTQAGYDQVQPKVDFVEPYYLVVWEDYREADYIPRLYGTRIAKDGTVLEPNGIHFDVNDTIFHNYYHIAISNDSVNFLLMWQKKFFPGYHYGVAFRVDTSGAVLDTGGIIIDSVSTFPVASFNGSSWLIIYSNYASWRIEGIRLSRDGNIITPEFRISNGFQYLAPTPPSLSFNGTNYLVTWTTTDIPQPPPQLDENIYGSRVSSDSFDLDTIDISITDAPSVQYSPKMTSYGDNYYTVWIDSRIDSFSDCTKALYGTFIDSAGNVQDTNGVPLTPLYSEAKSPALIISLNNKFFLCYSQFLETPYGSYRICGKFVDAPVGIEESYKTSGLIYKLEKNYPNPFTSTTRINYNIREEGFVKISVYNVSGRLIKDILSETKNPGIYSIIWNGKDKNGNPVSSGIYFYKMSIKDYIDTKKMIYIK
jgi:hypothetical protein